jgi:hypothetical protein
LVCRSEEIQSKFGAVCLLDLIKFLCLKEAQLDHSELFAFLLCRSLIEFLSLKEAQLDPDVKQTQLDPDVKEVQSVKGISLTPYL